MAKIIKFDNIKYRQERSEGGVGREKRIKLNIIAYDPKINAQFEGQEGGIYKITDPRLQQFLSAYLSWIKTCIHTQKILCSIV